MVSLNKHGCSTLHRLGNGTKYLVGQLFVAAFKHRRAYLNLSNKPLGGYLFQPSLRGWGGEGRGVGGAYFTSEGIFHLFFDFGILKWMTTILLNSLGIISKL